MGEYLSFLRGINISGRNKIAMTALKTTLESNGLKEVKTLLNSGNIHFFSEQTDSVLISEGIKSIIRERFGLCIPVFTISKDDFEDVLNHAPDWWGSENKELYDNLIFILPPADFKEIASEIGEPKKGLEKIENYKQVVFWTFRRNDYQKTNWWPKTTGAGVGRKLTIRTANTVKKAFLL